MKHNPMPEHPWEYISCDFYGPTHRGEYILVVVDVYSRFLIIRYVKGPNSESTIRAMDNILAE